MAIIFIKFLSCFFSISDAWVNILALSSSSNIDVISVSTPSAVDIVIPKLSFNFDSSSNFNEVLFAFPAISSVRNVS